MCEVGREEWVSAAVEEGMSGLVFAYVRKDVSG